MAADRSLEPDDGLLARHAAGDADAFAELVRRHRDRLWAVAVRTLGDREEAADAVQDALLSAYRAAGPGGSAAARFRGEAAVTTWLHRIVVNACLDRARRRAVRPTVPLPEEGPGEPAAPDRVAAVDTAMLVRSALQTLPPDQRAALVLVDMGGWSVEDAAAVLGVPTGTVKSRCARGRTRLLPLLAAARNPDAGARVPPPEAPSAPGHDREGNP